jgi:hypothetical protein
MSTTTLQKGSEDSEKQFPFLIFFLLQYRLKQVPNAQTDSSNFRDCNTCYQTPTVKALFFSESFLTAAMQHITSSSFGAGVNPTSNLHPDIRFPPSIYPQLNSLKREIRHSKVQTNAMEPLYWATGKRSNRPFENVNSDWLTILHSVSPTSYPAPRIPIPRPVPPPRQSAQPTLPTAYYQEQAAFYSQLPGPDPFYSEPAPVRPGPLRVFVYAVLSFFLWPLALLSTDAMRLISSVRSVLRLLPLVLLVSPVKLVVAKVKAVKPRWDVILALVLASQMVRMLPPIEVRGGVENWSDNPPLYTIFVQGKEVIGNGAVVQSKGF